MTLYVYMYGRAHSYCFAQRRHFGRQFSLSAFHHSLFRIAWAKERTSRRLATSPIHKVPPGSFTTAARRERWAGLRVARAALREAEERRRAEEEEEGEEG